MKKLTVEVDINDGDYICGVYCIDNPETLNKILAISKKIKEFQASQHSYFCNWPDERYLNKSIEEIYRDILTKESIEFFRNYVPAVEGFHQTIKSVIVETIVEKETIKIIF